MFIHLSNNESVSEKNIVGIFNLETASMQSDTREFLKQKQHFTKAEIEQIMKEVYYV